MTENAPGGALNLIVRTADQTRKDGLEIEPQKKCGEIVAAVIGRWSLPEDTDFTLVNVRTGKPLMPDHSLAQAGVMDGDTLEVQPVLVAG